MRRVLDGGMGLVGRMEGRAAGEGWLARIDDEFNRMRYKNTLTEKKSFCFYRTGESRGPQGVNSPTHG